MIPPEALHALSEFAEELTALCRRCGVTMWTEPSAPVRIDYEPGNIAEGQYHIAQRKVGFSGHPATFLYWDDK